MAVSPAAAAAERPAAAAAVAVVVLGAEPVASAVVRSDPCRHDRDHARARGGCRGRRRRFGQPAQVGLPAAELAALAAPPAAGSAARGAGSVAQLVARVVPPGAALVARAAARQDQGRRHRGRVRAVRDALRDRRRRFARQGEAVPPGAELAAAGGGPPGPGPSSPRSRPRRPRRSPRSLSSLCAAGGRRLPPGAALAARAAGRQPGLSSPRSRPRPPRRLPRSSSSLCAAGSGGGAGGSACWSGAGPSGACATSMAVLGICSAASVESATALNAVNEMAVTMR